MNDQEPKLWEKKTFTSAIVSALVAAVAAAVVCVARGETLALAQPSPVSVSRNHTGTVTGSCLPTLAQGR